MSAPDGGSGADPRSDAPRSSPAAPYSDSGYQDSGYQDTPYQNPGYPQQPYPQPPYSQPPYQQPGYAPPPYQQPGYVMDVSSGQPYAHYPYPLPPPRRTNTMAVAALVLGVTWMYGIASILALVFGYIARSQIRDRGESGNGFAVAGIVLGWVGLGGVLLVFVIPLIIGLTAGG